MKNFLKGIVVFAVLLALYYGYKKLNATCEEVKTEKIDSSTVKIDTSKSAVSVDSVSNKTIVK